MNFLALHPLTPDQLSAAVDLDQRCLGGLWTHDGYQREIDSPNSDLLVLHKIPEIPATSPLPHSLTPPAPIGLACAWAILDEAHITLLAIDPAYRRQGLGQVLLYALLALARQRGMAWATLEVRVSNQAAISLYQRFGFEAVGERPGYYQNPRENALILWRQGLQRQAFAEFLQQQQQALRQRLTQAGWQWSGEVLADCPPSTTR